MVYGGGGLGKTLVTPLPCSLHSSTRGHWLTVATGGVSNTEGCEVSDEFGDSPQPEHEHRGPGTCQSFHIQSRQRPHPTDGFFRRQKGEEEDFV